MEVLEAKKEVEIIKNFNSDISSLFSIEEEARKHITSGLSGFHLHQEKQKKIREILYEKNDNYRRLRGNISKSTLKVSQIAFKHNVPIIWKSYPAPAVGGPILDINMVYAILFDNSHGGIERSLILETLLKIEGACEEHLNVEFKKLINPLHWVAFIFTSVIRIPFMILKSSGFNIEKIEDHLWGKIFKLIEIIVLIYLLFYFGLKKSDIIMLIKSVLD